MLHLLVIALLCVGSLAAPQELRDRRLDNYLDLVFDNLQVILVGNGLDPAQLPNASVGFDKVVMGVQWHGEASVYAGWLRGLASIFRATASNFIRDEQDAITGISSGLGLGEMKGHYMCLAQFMDLGPIADVAIDVKSVSVKFAAELDKKLCRFQVKELNVERIGHIGVHIKGLGPLDWILETVVELVVNVVELFLRNTIENSMVTMVNEALDSVDLGIVGPLLGCDPITTTIASRKLL